MVSLSLSATRHIARRFAAKTADYCSVVREIVFLISAVSLIAAGCTSEPEATIEALSSVAEIAETQTFDDTEPVTTPQPGAAEPLPPSSSDPTVQAPANTSAPSTANTPSIPATAPATAPPTTANNDEEPVGDTPVLTSPPQSAGDEGGLAPLFFGFDAVTSIACSDVDPGTVTLRWEAVGAESISVAIGTDTQIFQAEQSPAGSLDVPLDCAGGSTYFVIAENPAGRTVRSTTVAP